MTHGLGQTSTGITLGSEPLHQARLGPRRMRHPHLTGILLAAASVLGCGGLEAGHFTAVGSGARAVAFARCGQLVALSRDGILSLWSSPGPSPTASENLGVRVRSAATTHGSLPIAAITDQGNVLVVTQEADRFDMRAVPSAPRNVTSVSLDATGQILATVSEDTACWLIDWQTGSGVSMEIGPVGERLTCVELLSTGDALLAGTGEGRMLYATLDGQVTSLAMPDGNAVVDIDSDLHGSAWGALKRNSIVVFGIGPVTTASVALGEDGRDPRALTLLGGGGWAVCARDRVILQPASARRVVIQRSHPARMDVLSFSADRQLVAAGNNFTDIYLFRVP